MTTSNLPAVRTTTALAVPQQRTTAQPAVPAPLRLSTALFIVSAIVAFLAGVSVYADRMVQAALIGGAAGGLLIVAGLELRWEHRK